MALIFKLFENMKLKAQQQLVKSPMINEMQSNFSFSFLMIAVSKLRHYLRTQNFQKAISGEENMILILSGKEPNTCPLKLHGFISKMVLPDFMLTKVRFKIISCRKKSRYIQFRVCQRCNFVLQRALNCLNLKW